METKIIQKLREIEQEHQVEVLFGWIFSLLVYFAGEEFLQELKELAKTNFNPEFKGY